MIIRNPVNPYPQNIAVDPNKALLKFTFMGERLGSYRIKIYPYSNTKTETEGSAEAGSSVGGSGVIDSGIINLKDYVYNNTEITVNKLSNLGVGANKSYTWEVEMCPDYTLNPNTFTPTFTSTRYFFQTVTTPIITATPAPTPNESGIIEPAFSINGTNVTYSPNANWEHTNVNDLESRNLKVKGYYQGSIKYYYFELRDEEYNVIETTPKTFSNEIKYNFSGLLPLKVYILSCFTVSQNDQYTNVVFNITTNYTIKEDINYPPVLICNENEANVKIKWIKDSVAVGRATGDYSIEDGKVKISSGEIVYDNITSFPIEMDKNNFAIGLKTIIDENTTKILDYINNDILYEIYVENYKFYLRYGHINSTNKTIQQCGQLKSNIVFSIQDYDTAEANTGYMWYDGKEYIVSNTENEYVLDVGEQADLYSILLQNTNGVVSCEFNLLAQNV